MQANFLLQNLQKRPHIRHGFSKKSDGNMSFKWGPEFDVVNNRQNFLHNFGIIPAQCVMMTVQHGSDIKIVTESHLGLGMNDLESAVPVDALITNEKNITLCLQTADCLPILFYDETKEVIAIAHLGWLGTNKKLAQKVISIMKAQFQSQPKDIQVGIGPGIHKESYLFDTPVIQTNDPNWQPYLEKISPAITAVDNIGYNVQQLIDSGVRKENIEISPIDTAKDLNYFSHHRATKTGEPEGRQLSIIELI